LRDDRCRERHGLVVADLNVVHTLHPEHPQLVLLNGFARRIVQELLLDLSRISFRYFFSMIAVGALPGRYPEFAHTSQSLS
jgi:hypothetical protein